MQLTKIIVILHIDDGYEVFDTFTRSFVRRDSWAEALALAASWAEGSGGKICDLTVVSEGANVQ